MPGISSHRSVQDASTVHFGAERYNPPTSLHNEPTVRLECSLRIEGYWSHDWIVWFGGIWLGMLRKETSRGWFYYHSPNRSSAAGLRSPRRLTYFGSLKQAQAWIEDHIDDLLIERTW